MLITLGHDNNQATESLVQEIANYHFERHLCMYAKVLEIWTYKQYYTKVWTYNQQLDTNACTYKQQYANNNMVHNVF